MNLETSNVLASGTSDGAQKGWDTRGRGRKTDEPVKHGIRDMLQSGIKMWGEHNLWSKLAQYGHVGNTAPFTPEEQKYLRGLKSAVGECKVGFCVMNAQRLSAYNRNPDLKYVEGLVTVMGIPIDHAWVEYKGKVYDPTLANEKWKMKDPLGGGRTLEKPEYFGVEVPKDLINKSQFKSEMYQFISHQYHEKDWRARIWK